MLCFPPAPAAFSFDSAPGERTISNAEVPLPRSPLSLAAGIAHRKGFLSLLWRTAGSPLFCGEPRAPLCAWHLLGRFCQCRKRFNARGAGGGSPRRNKLKVSPFPAGEGGWGDRGQEGKLKAGTASAAGGSSPLRHRSGRACKCRRGLAAPPGTTAAGIASAAGGSPPLRAPQWQGEQVPPGASYPPPPSKIFLPPPIFIFCSPIYGILKQEKPEGV